MTLAPMPDAEAIISVALRSALSVNVHSGVPKAPTLPFVIVQRIGGVPAVRVRLDRARLQVSCFGKDKSSAYALAAQARVKLLDLEGTQTGGAVITGVDDDLGITYAIDPETGRDRYVFGVSVYLHVDDSVSP